VVKARARVSLGNGSGNGGNGNGDHNNGDHGGGPTRHLRLFLPRSGDYDADVRRMQEIDQLLRSSEGNDPVTIHMPDNVGVVLLRPKHTVLLSEALAAELREVLGEEAVVVE
jgi:DNA polymerase-3 subunit alpha